MDSLDALSPEERATGERLLSEIVQNPNADGPRLVYADWLTERGDPRGAFIVDQCRLAQLDETDPEWCVLYARSERARFQHGASWTKPFRELLGMGDEEDEEDGYWGDTDLDPPLDFCRGFIERVHVSVKEPEQLEKLARMTPLRSVAVAPGRKIREIAPLLSRLGVPGVEIRMYDWNNYGEDEYNDEEYDEDDDYDDEDDEDDNDDYDDEDDEDDDQAQPSAEQGLEDEALTVVQMLGLLDLSKIERLEIQGYLSLPEVREATRLLEAAPLRSLSLQSAGLTSGGAAHLAGGGFLKGLEDLDLSNNTVGVQGLRKLLAARGPQPLTLRLGNNGNLRKHIHLVIDGRPLRALELQNVVSAKLLERLAQKDASTGLRHLRVGGIDDEQLQLLSTIPFDSLTRLDLGNSGYGPAIKADSFRALCEAPQFRSLVELSLSGCEIGNQGVKSLVGSHLDRLDVLDLSHCGISEKGMDMLASWPGLAQVVELRLTGNRLGVRGLEVLIASKLDPVRVVVDEPRSKRLRHALYERFGEAVHHW